MSLPVLSASDLGPTTANVTIDLQNAAASANRLDVWIDMNQDGDWNDPGEQVFSNYNLGTTSGAQTLAFTVPQDTGGNIVYGTTVARFRLSTAGGLLPTGSAADGEVEDYRISIVAANHPPVLDPIGDQSVEEGILLQFTVTAGDPDDSPPDKVTLSASGLPAGATFTPATGVFAWTPGAGQQGEYLVTFTATDDGTPPLSDFEVVTITVTPPTLHVADAAPTVSGSFFRFNRPLDTSVLNLYDGAGGTFGPPDLMVTDGSGKTVRGSMVVSDDGLGVEFVKTGGVLGEGNYTLTLKSAVNGFKDVDGRLLDGNQDGTPGDDFNGTSVIMPLDRRVVSIADIARGAGQPVNVPSTATGLPIRIDNADGLTSIELLVFIPPSLQIIAILNPGLPEDWKFALDTDTPGVARATASGTMVLSGTDVEVVRLRAEVTSDAPYGAAHLVRLENVSLNGAKTAAIGDVAVYKEVYLGDTDGSGIHSSADAYLAVQAALGLASGFEAHRSTDPLIDGDTDGSGALSAADAYRIVREGLGLDEPFIPDNPGIGVTPVGGGVDSQFQIDVNVPANAGWLVTVPVKLDIEPAATNVGGFDFDLRFGPARLTIQLPEGVSAGADTAGWAMSATLVVPGQLRVGMVSASGRPLAVGVREIARLQFHVAASVPDAVPLAERACYDDAVPVSERPGYVVGLDIEPVDARAGGYTWTDADGSMLIQPTERVLAATPRERVWRDLDAKAELLDSVLADLTHEIASSWQ